MPRVLVVTVILITFAAATVIILAGEAGTAGAGLAVPAGWR